MDSREIGPMIRLDFDDLKLPHPPQENIRRPERDGVTVSWVTRADTPLYRTVTRIVDEQDDYPTRTAKYRCRIDGLILKELHNPSLRSRGESTPPRRRRSASPLRPPIMRRVESVDKIDNVMRSLRKIRDSITQGDVETNELHETLKQPPNEPQATSKKAHPIPAKPVLSDRRDYAIPRLQDELQQVRKEIAENMEKAARLERQIDSLLRLSPGEIDEGRQDLDEFTMASLELSQERKKREEVEQILNDVRRECSHPTVVPELLKMIGSLDLSRGTAIAPI
ncbi:hypothetical protein BDZ94DRAFT_1252845 [Collybia nuda]|uniref:Uncharacterized protein n=1 Tax=Collybia nuda TaxID=64659 RepID=A0A9P6CMK1_9AGAR|nr:hypothetical protein BDZ94DRAFT_1252845 [Collybia nuda]